MIAHSVLCALQVATLYDLAGCALDSLTNHFSAAAVRMGATYKRGKDWYFVMKNATVVSLASFLTRTIAAAEELGHLCACRDFTPAFLEACAQKAFDAKLQTVTVSALGAYRHCPAPYCCPCRAPSHACTQVSLTKTHAQSCC